MEEMMEFILENKAIIDNITLVIIPIGPDSYSSINKVIELILEWQYHEIDRGNNRKEKFGVKVSMDSSGVFRWLHMDQFGQMFSHTLSGIIRYMDDKSKDERTHD